MRVEIAGLLYTPLESNLCALLIAFTSLRGGGMAPSGLLLRSATARGYNFILGQKCQFVSVQIEIAKTPIFFQADLINLSNEYLFLSQINLNLHKHSYPQIWLSLYAFIVYSIMYQGSYVIVIYLVSLICRYNITRYLPKIPNTEIASTAIPSIQNVQTSSYWKKFFSKMFINK